MTNYDKVSLHLHWRYFAETRICPPWRVLFGEPSSLELEVHVQHCMWCREDVVDEDARTLHESIYRRFPHQAPDNPEMAVGQIWLLRSSLGSWGSPFRYFNPPKILILGERTRERVRVAQVWDDEQPLFRGPGDINIPDGTDSYGFVESWNAYTIPTAWLYRYIRSVPAEVTKKAAVGRRPRLKEAPPLPPGEGNLLRAIFSEKMIWDFGLPKNAPTILKRFREIEFETGQFFARKAKGWIHPHLGGGVSDRREMM